MNDMLSVREAALLLRLSTRTIYRQIETGQLSAVRVGKQYRLPRAALEKQLGHDINMDKLREAAQSRH